MLMKTKSLKIGGLVLVGTLINACATPGGISSVDGGVYEKVFDNGLKVIVKVDRRAPVVVSQVWYKVGGSHEPDGLTGISHVLEHMMFKGTSELGPNEFSRIIAANGGRENAFTGRDYTAYFQRLEKSRLAVSFELEADRMQNLQLDADEFAKEVKVVQEERRLRTEDRPEALVYERFMATAFKSSPYKNPIIGWPQDLEKLTLDDLERWYRSYYAPNNATVVVVGDVDPDSVYELAQRYFGELPRRQVAPVLSSTMSSQPSSRRISVSAPAKVPYLLMGFHVPSLNSAGPDAWEPYALSVLAYVLDGGKSARLESNLVRRQRVAASISVGYDPVSRLSTLFLVDANPSDGKDVAQIEAAILSEIDRLTRELVTTQELQKAKAQIVASHVYQRDSGFYQAMKLGELETVGLDWRLEGQMVDRLRSISAEQIRSVVRKFFRPANMTIAVLKPVAS